jgi:hypothetical protein
MLLWDMHTQLPQAQMKTYSAGHHSALVNNGLLQIALDLHEQLRVGTADGAENADGICPVQICLGVHVLHVRGKNRPNVVSHRTQQSL